MKKEIPIVNPKNRHDLNLASRNTLHNFDRIIITCINKFSLKTHNLHQITSVLQYRSGRWPRQDEKGQDQWLENQRERNEIKRITKAKLRMNLISFEKCWVGRGTKERWRDIWITTFRSRARFVKQIPSDNKSVDPDFRVRKEQRRRRSRSSLKFWHKQDRNWDGEVGINTHDKKLLLRLHNKQS